MPRLLPLLLLALAPLAGCLHVKGIVTDPNGHPLTSARFTVGIPDGVGTLATHNVNSKGEFDFQISPTEDDTLYIYDSNGPAANTTRRIDRTEISDHMTVRIRPNSPDMMPGMNIGN